MKLFLKSLMLLSGCCVVALLIGVKQFYGGAVTQECVIELSQNLLAENTSHKVVDSLVMPHIRHHRAFNYYADRLNLWDRIKNGRYELKHGMDVIDIVRMLKIGVQSPVDVTFNNIRSIEALAGRIAMQIEADSISILKAVASPQLASELDYKTEEILALFIPNTYNLWWTITPEGLVRRMKEEYDHFWTPARERAREHLGLSRIEVSTLASIVYEESLNTDEMPRIAGVYINRLRRGMKLQSDPTVKFALKDPSIKRILYKHLEYDSPYNTYKYRGLPPAPIAAASITALDSVLGYEKHDFLYFCARPNFDGYHDFTSSYAQHKLNATRYAEELDRRGVR